MDNIEREYLVKYLMDVALEQAGSMMNRMLTAEGYIDRETAISTCAFQARRRANDFTFRRTHPDLTNADIDDIMEKDIRPKVREEINRRAELCMKRAKTADIGWTVAKATVEAAMASIGQTYDIGRQRFRAIVLVKMAHGRTFKVPVRFKCIYEDVEALVDAVEKINGIIESFGRDVKLY